MKFAHAIVSSAVVAVVASAVEAEIQDGYNAVPQYHTEHATPYQAEHVAPYQAQHAAPYQAEHAPYQAEHAAPYQAEHAPYQAEHAPYQAEHAPYQAEHAPYQAQQAPYQAEHAAPYQAEQAAPYQAEQTAYKGEEAPYKAVEAPYKGEQAAPYQAEHAPYQGVEAPYKGEQAPYQAEKAAPYQGVETPYNGEQQSPYMGEPTPYTLTKKSSVPVYKSSPYQKASAYGKDRMKEQCNYGMADDYMKSPEYDSGSAFCKMEQIWGKIKENDTINRWYVGPEFDGHFAQDMNISYDYISDSMFPGRIKRTHPRGVSTKVQFIAAPDSPYTGVFRGADFGIMRISETTMTTPEIAKTAPGYGLKLFRDGIPSANMLTMYSFDGQPSYNYFKNRWTTILREMSNECSRETLGKKIAEVTDYIGATSVQDMAMYDQYGNLEEKPYWPHQVDAEPYDVYGWTDKYQNDFQDQLSTIPAHTVLFKLYGYDVAPEFGGEERLMGWIISRSETTTSLWGDQQLYFKHQRMDDDIAVRPYVRDWLEFWDGGRFYDSPLKNPAPQQKCPFFYLFERAGLV